MKYGFIGAFVKMAFANTAFNFIKNEVPEVDIADYKKRVIKEYKAIVKRTPSVGSMKDNMFVITMYAGALFIALYKEAKEYMTPELIEKLVKEVTYSPLMVKAKKGKSAFTEKEITARTKQSKWSRDHIDEYPMNWYYYFKNVPDKDEYFITHKQYGICKLTKQEGVYEITKYLCAMDYYTFEMQGAVLDRTKTLGYGDDECNFHVMSKERAEEIGFIKSSNAK